MRWLRVNQIAKEIEAPVFTVRRYIQKHQNFINSKKVGKKILVDPSCLDVLKEIRKLYVIDCMIDSEINKTLINKGFTQYIEDATTEESRPTSHENTSGELEGLEGYLEKMERRLLEKLENDKREFMEQQQHKYDELMEQVAQRDYALMEYIQQRRATAATKKKRWWQFWK